jgi:hypothetical protein
MGLDIRAFNGLQKCEIQSEDAYSKYPNCAHLRPEDLFFNQSGGLDGYYIHSGDYMTFRAGPYSAYGKWRRMLAEMIGYPNIDSLWEVVRRDVSIGEVLSERTSINIPFIELLYFSDCEGVIGEKVAGKLYNDFVNNRDKAAIYSVSIKNSDWLSLYDDFTKAFRIASNNGCVEFC